LGVAKTPTRENHRRHGRSADDPRRLDVAHLDDMAKKAKDLLNDKRVKDVLNREKAEEVGESVVNAVAGAADKITGGKFHDTIEDVREAAEKKLGKGD
jgi:hypothetical protein